MIYELFPNYVPRPPLPRKVGGVMTPSSYGSAAPAMSVTACRLVYYKTATVLTAPQYSQIKCSEFDLL